DSQNTTDTAVTANNQQVAIKTKAQTKRDLSLKLEVTKASSDEQIFSVTNSTQSKEVTLPSKARESETQASKTEENTSEDKGESDQTWSSSVTSTSESKSQVSAENSTEASKEKNIATQADEPRNIKDLMKSGDKFFTNVEAKINNKAIEEGQVINAEDLIELIYHWE